MAGVEVNCLLWRLRPGGGDLRLRPFFLLTRHQVSIIAFSSITSTEIVGTLRGTSRPCDDERPGYFAAAPPLFKNGRLISINKHSMVQVQLDGARQHHFFQVAALAHQII